MLQEAVAISATTFLLSLLLPSPIFLPLLCVPRRPYSHWVTCLCFCYVVNLSAPEASQTFLPLKKSSYTLFAAWNVWNMIVFTFLDWNQSHTQIPFVGKKDFSSALYSNTQSFLTHIEQPWANPPQISFFCLCCTPAVRKATPNVTRSLKY